MTDLRCYNCGFENVDRAAYCERCAAPLGGATPGQIYAPQQQRAPALEENWRLPMFVLILGIAIAVVGVIVYVLGFHSMMSDASDPNWDPFVEDGFMASFDLLLLSYVIMGVGGIIFFMGLIWLVLKTG